MDDVIETRTETRKWGFVRRKGIESATILSARQRMTVLQLKTVILNRWLMTVREGKPDGG